MTTTVSKPSSSVTAVSAGNIRGLPIATTHTSKWEEIGETVKAARPMFLPPPYVRPGTRKA